MPPFLESITTRYVQRTFDRAEGGQTYEPWQPQPSKILSLEFDLRVEFDEKQRETNSLKTSRSFTVQPAKLAKNLTARVT